MEPYFHRIQYYETDAMGIAHHSNYVRWFEEARTDLLLQAGYGYKAMEEAGIFIPVLGITADFKRATHYQEIVQIDCRITGYTGVRLSVSYCIHYPDDDAVLCEGTSTHCFVNKDGRPVSPRRCAPEIDHLFSALLNA